jgi:hypothetical protein
MIIKIPTAHLWLEVYVDHWKQDLESLRMGQVIMLGE